jgi:hypothetical protein
VRLPKINESCDHLESFVVEERYQTLPSWMELKTATFFSAAYPGFVARALTDSVLSSLAALAVTWRPGLRPVRPVGCDKTTRFYAT